MFDQGWTVARVRGIPVRIHFTLLLFLPYVAFAAAREFVLMAATADLPPSAYVLPPIVWGVVLAVGLFVSILLHELAHSLVAVRAGARVRSITLMMLGGVTRMESEVPLEREAWMAFVGPLTSLVIAVAAYALYRWVPFPPGIDIALFLFAATNAMLGLFNLLPAFPMDGGRVLRGLLARRLGRERATRVATWLGKAMAVVFGIFALLTFNLILVLIAGFVYLGAAAEQERLVTRDLLEHFHVVDLMTGRLGDARPGETIGEVARRLLRLDLVGARVLSDGEALPGDGHARTLGVVTTTDLARLAADGPATASHPVSETMRTDLPAAHPEDAAAAALEPLMTGAAPAIVVLDALDAVVGLVTPSELQRALALGPLQAGAWRDRP